MNQKDLNREVVQLIATKPFYSPEIFCRYFADEFTMEVPSAPPGMPNYFSTWEAERCFEWLNRSVRRWNGKINTLYPTADADVFWVDFDIDADVYWGEQDGHFKTQSFMRIEFCSGKTKFISWRFNTWAMLMAAGKRIHSNCLKLPEDKNGNTDHFNDDYLIDIYDREVTAYMQNPVFGEFLTGDKDHEIETDASANAVYQTRQINIYQFGAGVDREKYRKAEVLAPNYRKDAIFLRVPEPGALHPIEDAHDLETARRLFSWNKLCSPWMYRDPRSKFYFTDDPDVIFVEMNSHGPGCWRRKSVELGHYKENFLVRLTLDRAGRLVHFEEILAPVNKLNSCAGDIPSFPYYH